MRDVILERIPLQPGDLADFDRNGDGAVDVADLVALKEAGEVRIAFSRTTSLGIEGPTARIKLLASAPYSGQLVYTQRDLPGGVEQPGTTTISTQQTDEGYEATLTVTLSEDDLDISESARTIELVIQGAAGYASGTVPAHLLVVQENDAIWRGTLELGTGPVTIDMEILQDSGNLSMRLLAADFAGIFPPGGSWSPSEPPVLNDTSFQARFQGIPAQYLNLAGVLTDAFPDVSLVRELSFAGTAVDLEAGLISGDVIESIRSAEHGYLDAPGRVGSFRLVRALTAVEAPAPVLQ